MTGGGAPSLAWLDEQERKDRRLYLQDVAGRNPFFGAQCPDYSDGCFNCYSCFKFREFWESLLRRLFSEISEEIKNYEAKLRDNCNVISQLKTMDKGIRDKIKMLKRERFRVAMGMRS